ncbi:MAG: response regulator transcription factor, partial [Clostridiales bacterium]|nr:response regulator transcription factor [Clostridiales bacterium]
DFWYDKALEAFEDKNYHMFDIDETVMKMVILCKSGIAIKRMDVKEIAASYEEASQFDLPAIDHGEINAYQTSLFKTQSVFYGRMKLLEETFNPIYECLKKCHNKTITYYWVCQAEIFYQRNSLEECLKVLMESLEPVLDLNYAGATVPFFFTLAKAKRAHGDTAGAFESVSECRKKLGRSNALWGYIIDTFEAGLYLEMNDAPAAENLLCFSRMDIYDEISNTSEFELYIYSKYLLQAGESDKAITLLSRLNSFAEKAGRHYSRIEILCLLSAAYCLDKDMDSSVAMLGKALELGMEDGYIRAFLDEPRIEKVLSRYINERKSGSDEKRNYAKKLYRLMVNRPQAANDKAGCPEDQANGLLTGKELQVLNLIVGGCCNLEIASELGISGNTVKYHTQNIFSKLEVKSRQNAIIKAKEMGLTQ